MGLDRRARGPSHNDVRGAAARPLTSEEFQTELVERIQALRARDEGLVLEQLGRWIGRWLARSTQ